MTRSLHDPVEIIQDLETWHSPSVELDCYGTDNAGQIATMVEEFCRHHLDSRVRGYLFYGASIGSTHGLQLEDGRNVVIKVRPPPETNPDLRFDLESLRSICKVMNWIADLGYPCPKIILGPTPLGRASRRSKNCWTMARVEMALNQSAENL